MRGPGFTRQEKKRRLGRGLGSLISAPVEVKIPPPANPSVAPGGAFMRSAAAPPIPAANREMFHVEHSNLATVEQDGIAAAESGTRGHEDVESTSAAHPGRTVIFDLPLELIDPNPFQPRRQFDPAGLAALADSIRSAGVMQPILVRRVAGGSQHDDVPRGTLDEAPSANVAPGSGLRYQLIAGERRLRAAKLIPLASIPAVIREIDDRTAAEWALIENVQREDLNPIERAEAFKTLIEHFDLTHQDISERVGLERSSITNILRLNELDETTKAAVRSGRLTPGHAKALLAVGEVEVRRTLTMDALKEEWSVRELERRIQDVLAHHAGVSEQTLTERVERAAQGGRKGGAKESETGAAAKTYLANLEKQLGEHLGTRVHLRAGSKKGTGAIIIEFFSLDQFDGLIAKMGIDPDRL